MTELTKEKIIEETNRVTKQANAFEFKDWHIVVAAAVLTGLGMLALRGLGVL